MKFRSQGQASDPVQLAQQIKEAGISIITVGFNQFGGEGILVVFEEVRIPAFLQEKIQGLAKIASPGMAFNGTETDLVGEIQRNGLCQSRFQIRKYF